MTLPYSNMVLLLTNYSFFFLRFLDNNEVAMIFLNNILRRFHTTNQQDHGLKSIQRYIAPNWRIFDGGIGFLLNHSYIQPGENDQRLCLSIKGLSLVVPLTCFFEGDGLKISLVKVQCSLQRIPWITPQLKGKNMAQEWMKLCFS